MPFWLIGEHHGKKLSFKVPPGRFRVGRDPASDFVLPSQTVSRTHAEVRRDAGVLEIEDRGSRNGVRVNGERLEGSRELALGDAIEFGSVTLRLLDREPSTSPVWSDEDSLGQSVIMSREESEELESTLTEARPGTLRVLTKAGELPIVSGSEEKTYDRVLEIVESAIPTTRTMLLLRENGGELVQRAARSRGQRATGPLKMSRSLVGKVVEEGTSILTQDAQADQRFMHQQSVMMQDIHSAMAVPLFYHDEILGVLYADSSDLTETYTMRDLRVFTVLGHILGAKIANARLLESQKERDLLREQLRLAADIQTRQLPQEFPEIPGYEIVGHLQSCDAVGGDLYDAGELDDGRIQIVLADVSGHGMGAALLMSEVLATVRALRSQISEVDLLVSRIDHLLLRTTGPEHYATMFLGALDPKTHQLQFVNAGHPASYLLHGDGTLHELDATGHPVGLLDLPGLVYEWKSVEIPVGATLVIYSDGISEAERGSEMFQDGKFAELLKEQCAGLSAADTAKRILDTVAEFMGDTPHEDDQTLVVVRRSA